jgi:hypothetical protein
VRVVLCSELEWVRQTPKGRQTKSKSRLQRYEQLLQVVYTQALLECANNMLKIPGRETIAHSTR